MTFSDATHAPVISPRYDGTTIMLHWLTAGLVALVWFIAQVIDFFPRGMPRTSARSMHIVLGVVLVVIVLARLFWRFTQGRRIVVERSPMEIAAKAGHGILYLLLIGVLVAGLGFEWVRGDSIFGLFAIPQFDPVNARALRETVGDVHETLANAILVVAGLHAVMALGHHYVLRDGVLRRMMPGWCR